MELVAKLPFDLQEKILEEYLKCEQLRALVRNHPIEFAMLLETESFLSGELRKGDIEFTTKIWCDETNFVRANFDIFWSSWCGWSYNIKNVPLGWLSESNCLDIIHKWKTAFYEFVRLNHTFGKRSFKNAEFKWFRIEYFSVGQDKVVRKTMNKLKSKKIAQIVKNAWFNLNIEHIKPLVEKLKEIDNQDDFDCPSMIDPIVGRFRMDDSCPDLGSNFVRVPFTDEDLELVRDKLPFVYKCLEDYDELWSPRLEFSPGMKKYIQLYNQFYDRPETLPPPEEFNALVYDIITKELEIGWYSLSYDYCSKYVVLPKIHELLNWCV